MTTSDNTIPAYGYHSGLNCGNRATFRPLKANSTMRRLFPVLNATAIIADCPMKAIDISSPWGRHLSCSVTHVILNQEGPQNGINRAVVRIYLAAHDRISAVGYMNPEALYCHHISCEVEKPWKNLGNIYIPLKFYCFTNQWSEQTHYFSISRKLNPIFDFR